jgi:hypothetical protein
MSDYQYLVSKTHLVDKNEKNTLLSTIISGLKSRNPFVDKTTVLENDINNGFYNSGFD